MYIIYVCLHSYYALQLFKRIETIKYTNTHTRSLFVSTKQSSLFTSRLYNIVIFIYTDTYNVFGINYHVTL